jgi:S1-C subfamily serine protease
MTVLPDPPDDPIAAEHRAPRGVAPVPPASRRRQLRGALVPFLAGLAVMLAAVLAAGAFQPADDHPTRADVARAIGDALGSQTPAPPAAELVYAAIRPSIVLIEATGIDPEGAAASGEGTGVVVTDQGEILTALHVVAGASQITLTFADGSTGTGTVTSRDEAKDIAVVTADPVPAVPPAVLGSPGSLRIGSDAYIVGNPFGLYGSMSAGVVSGLDRTFRDPDTQVVREGLIQVDAAVNPGNSGGPLLDRAGRVVGIVTALLNPTDQRVFIGIGLAVPIDVAGGGAGLPPF